jgi:xylulokinase
VCAILDYFIISVVMLSSSLDDKLFSFWYLQGDSYPFSHVKGIFRFETGIKVNEFRDLRANPRCLLESQVLSFRVKWSRMIATGLLGPSGRGRGNVTQQQTPLPGRSHSVLSSLGLPFDPYDYQPLPTRILVTGAAANFPSVANLVGDVFNAPVFMPNTQVDSAQVVPHRNAPAQGYPGRAAIGAAYVARWVWGREWGTGGGVGGNGRGLGGFEEEIKRLLGKRWVATGGLPVRTNVNGVVGPSTMAMGAGGSGGNSGTSTPYGHPGSRSSLGATVFVEEDEDEMEEMERIGASGGAGYMNTIPFGGELGGRQRTHTNSTVDTMTSSGSSGVPSTAYTTPDPNLGMPSPAMGVNGSSGATPTTPTPLTPVVAMPTADAEAQIGLAKVAEPDVDAFMTYAAIVPEYCRLEGMLVKSLV